MEIVLLKRLKHWQQLTTLLPSNPGGGALDLRTTIRSAQNLASKIRPLRCSEFP